MATQAERIAALEATIAHADRLGYSPATLRAIADTCSTQADRAGQTQDEVFTARGTP